MDWQENDEVINQMIKGSSGELWGFRLEESSHFPLLRAGFDFVGNKGKLLDLGCGAGDVGRVWSGSYLGVDLNWVVDRVAKVCNPSFEYVHADVNLNTIKELPHSDILLMNGFLETYENPHEIFDEILRVGFKNIIIHRQKLSNNTFSLEKRDSYGGSSVFSSIMSFERIQQSIQKYSPDTQIAVARWQGDYHTIAVRKNEIR